MIGVHKKTIMKTEIKVLKIKPITQWIAATDVFLLMVMFGGNFGWISPFLGRLCRPNPPFEVTREQISWVASLVSISRIVGIITGSVAANYFGTKKSLYTSGFYYICAWVSLIYANCIEIVYINQCCCGLGMGTLWAIYPLYLGEIVNPNIRGTIISFVMSGSMTGLLYGNIIGAHAEPWIFGLVNLFLSGIFLVTFYFLPSTPQHLISCNKLKEAKDALRFYNDSSFDLNKEFDKLQEFIESSPRVSLLKSVQKLKDPINLKTFIMINIVYSLVQLSGTYTILEYLEIIIMAGKIEIILPSTLVTIMSAVTLPSAWLSVLVSDKFGRVTMLLFSCVVFCVAFIGWGLSFHLMEIGFSPLELQWLVIVSALVFRIIMTVGINPIVPVLISEMFAPNVKNVSACLCNITCSLCTFISIKYFHIMVDHMTYKYLFYFYAGLILAIGIYCKTYIPETKGKTLQEIQELLFQNNKVKIKNMSKQENLSSVCAQEINKDVHCTKL